MTPTKYTIRIFYSKPETRKKLKNQFLHFKKCVVSYFVVQYSSTESIDTIVTQMQSNIIIIKTMCMVIFPFDKQSNLRMRCMLDDGCIGRYSEHCKGHRTVWLRTYYLVNSHYIYIYVIVSIT